MHGSSASSRPRQRTSTSCTECRRRKQKCNQAKDRPCNNCARRYPPVLCTYDNAGSSSGSTVDRLIDLHDEQSLADSGRPGDNAAYEHHASQSNNYGGYPISSGDNYASSSATYYSPAQTSTSYWPQQDQPWAGQYASSSSGSNNYGTAYYTSGNASGSDQSYDTGYYANTYSVPYSQQNSWLPTTGDPRTFVGSGTAYDALNDLSIDTSRRNGELVHYFHEFMAPYLVTIDGNDPPEAFYREWLPFMTQSPLLSWLMLLSSSCYQSFSRGLEVAKVPETVAIQGRIVRNLNVYFTGTKARDFGLDAITAVLYLAIHDWYYGAQEERFWKHMKGLKEMLRLCGGLDCIPTNSIIRKQLIIVDYQVACSFEQELFLHEDSSQDRIFSVFSYPKTLESPLLASGISFKDLRSTFPLSREAIEILDHIKALTSSIRSIQASSQDATAEALAELRSNAILIYNCILSLDSQAPTQDSISDSIYSSIRLTALIYTSAIHSVSPLSRARQPEQIEELHSEVWNVSLTRWKQLPGILLWIVLVIAAAGERGTKEKKSAEKMVHNVAMYIGVINQDVAVGCMRAFMGVQRWVGGKDPRAFGTGDALEQGLGLGG